MAQLWPGPRSVGKVKYVASNHARNRAPLQRSQGIITGLTVTTAYWLDVGLAAITGGTATITDVGITAFEL